MLWVICLVYIVYFSFSTVAAYMANKVVYIIQRQCLRRVRTEQQVRELTESRRYSAWWRWRRPWTGLASAAARDDDRPSSATTRWRTRTRSTTRRRTRDKRSSRCRLPDAEHHHHHHHHHLFRPAVQNSSYKYQLTTSRTVRLSLSANNCP